MVCSWTKWVALLVSLTSGFDLSTTRVGLQTCLRLFTFTAVVFEWWEIHTLASTTWLWAHRKWLIDGLADVVCIEHSSVVRRIKCHFKWGCQLALRYNVPWQSLEKGMVHHILRPTYRSKSLLWIFIKQPRHERDKLFWRAFESTHGQPSARFKFGKNFWKGLLVKRCFACVHLVE